MDEKDDYDDDIEDNNQNLNFASTLLKENEDNNNNNNQINEIKELNSENLIKNEIINNSLNKISNISIYKTSELNGKTIYHIKGDFIDKKSEIIRRYRDFDLLHLKLNQNWPGIFIPPIAQKKIFWF